MNQSNNTKTSGTPTVRCAIYTRKSTDEKLELDFNSLDAQRDSAEAYIVSQKSQGWVCLADRYDDGGFSGGTVDRPAFQRLMADVEAGRIDCILVYKIDRLSRSLMDFARIMETLDRHGVSLVSVTQQFNTTSSMGRLTLNILLSFAQFEREIISERTRDKIASARRRGKWTGGAPVLGYDRARDSRGTRLVVNEDEAKRVRCIFKKYLELHSILETVHWLDAQGWRNKQYTTNKGIVRGGKDFDKSTLLKLLTNRLYLGKIVHNGQCFDGEHEAIVDEDLFGRVQGQLARKLHEQTLSEIGKANLNKHDELDTDAKRRMTESEAELDAAREEWQRAIKDARDKRRQREQTDNDTDPQRMKNPDDLLDVANDALAGLGDLLAEQTAKITSQGTFVASNVLGLQSSSAADRMANGIDRIERNTRPLRDAQEMAFA